MTAFAIHILTCSLLSCAPALPMDPAVAIAPNQTACLMQGQQAIPQLNAARILERRDGDVQFKVDCRETSERVTEQPYGVVGPPSFDHTPGLMKNFEEGEQQ